jgi:hypothetical protein
MGQNGMPQGGAGIQAPSLRPKTKNRPETRASSRDHEWIGNEFFICLK